MKYSGSLFLLVFVVACAVVEDSPKMTLSDWFWAQRAYPQGRVNSAVFHQEREKASAHRNQRLRSGEIEWDFEGPVNIGGRITDIEMIQTSMDLIWVGSASGGAFKSEDQGQTWTPMTELEGAPPIGDIEVRETNPQEVWIGTGETNGGSGSIAYEGFGVLRSRNGGNTWEHLGLEQSGSIGKIILHPRDPATIYVAAMGYLFEPNSQRGVFKSTDGGQTWENVLYIDDVTGASDIIIDPVNPEVLYVSMWERIKYPDHRQYWGPNSGIYKTEDGGQTWNKLDVVPQKENLGRIGIAMAPSDHNQLYALVIGEESAYEGIFHTTNGGQTWENLNQNLDFNYGNSGYWFCNLTVNPANADEIFICGLNVFKVFNGGQNRATICDIHVDQHSIFLHPQDPNFGLIGNDGGLYRSFDQFSTCDHYENLPLTQFYTCALDPMEREVIYGGTQDNNPLIRRRGMNNWEKMLGGDGFVTLPDPRDNSIIFTEYQFGNIFKSVDYGKSWRRIDEGLDLTRSNWNSPFMFSPFNPDIMFFGSYRMHKSTDQGESWVPISGDLSNGPGGNLIYGTITSFDVSPIAEEVMIAGTDDGNVWITISAGSQWTQVNEGLPERWVTRVVCDPFDVDKFYVTYSGLKWNEYLPHVFRSSDVGKNWEDISGNLPEVPVNDLIVDPRDAHTYWAATDLGVYESLDEGNTWTDLGVGMPVAIVNDIDFRSDTRTLLAATYGRSMYSISLSGPTTSNTQLGRNATPLLYAHHGKIYLKGAEPGPYRIECYNTSGQIMRAKEIEVLGVDNGEWIFQCNPNNGKTQIIVLKDRRGYILYTLKVILG